MSFPETQRVSLRSLLREKELWILVALGCLYFGRPLFGGETFFFRDLYLRFLPQKQLFVDLVKAGQLPLWDPYVQGGQPYLADINNLSLYPSNALYIFLPLLTAFNWDIVLHLILCAIGVYLFARVLGFPPIYSLMAAVIYEYCGFTLSVPNLWLLATPHLPFLFLFWHLFLLEGRKRWFVSSVIVGVMQVLSGRPEMVPITLLSVLCWGAFFPFSLTLRRTLAVWLLMVLLIAGISAVQIIPTAEMALQSSRASGTGYASFTTYSLNPKRLPEMVFSGFLGRTDALSESDFWGREVESVEFPLPYFLSIYFGILTITLAIAGGISNEATAVLPARVRRFLLAFLLVFVFLSMGRFVPFFELFYSIPFVRWFRYPVKLLAGAILPMALLAASAAEIHFRADRSATGHSRKFLIAAWVILLALGGLTFTFFNSVKFANGFQFFFFSKSAENIRQGLQQSFFLAFVIWLLVTFVYHYHKIKSRSWQPWILACVLIVDLLIAGKLVNPFTSREFFTKTPNLALIVQKAIHGGKFFREESPAVLSMRAPSNDIVWEHRFGLEVLNLYLATFYRIPIIFHRDMNSMAQRRLMELKAAVDSLPWERRLQLLSAGAVSLILTPQEVSIPGLRLLAKVHNPSSQLLYLYQNEKAAPRIGFVTQATVANSDSEALKVMIDPNYDPRRSVVLESNVSKSTPGVCENFNVNKKEFKPNSSSFLVRNDCDGYLVLAEPYYSGWNVYVDGRKTSTVKANYAFTALHLKAGNHLVQRRYMPLSVILGGITSAIFILLLWWIPVRLQV